MSKRKKPNSTFALEEKNGVVTASVQDEDDYSLKHTIHGMPHPRIRAPRQDKESIKNRAEFEASPNQPYYNSEKEYLETNIESTSQEINKHIQEIRKSIKRMQSLTHYIVTAKEILHELEDNK